MRNATLYIAEPLTEGVTTFFAAERVLAAGATAQDNHQIIELRGFGRGLVLNGRLHRCDLDREIHREALAHPALVAHPHPKRVLLLGAGGGDVLREILRHRSVERVVVVEPQSALVEHARAHLADWSDGAFDDPRTRLIKSDVRGFLADAREADFDVIIADLPGPLDGGAAARCYTREAFAAAKALLAPGGLFAIAAGSAALTRPEQLVDCRATLQDVFKTVRLATVLLTSTLEPRAVALASDDVDPAAVPVGIVVERRAERDVAAVAQHAANQPS
ncbi:MAG: hypothetical protein KC549_07635 [Myxococcales bacterium]|nr:hypothetical protein [Myxococcales bacterium]